MDEVGKRPSLGLHLLAEGVILPLQIARFGDDDELFAGQDALGHYLADGRLRTAIAVIRARVYQVDASAQGMAQGGEVVRVIRLHPVPPKPRRADPCACVGQGSIGYVRELGG